VQPGPSTIAADDRWRRLGPVVRLALHADSVVRPGIGSV